MYIKKTMPTTQSARDIAANYDGMDADELFDMLATDPTPPHAEIFKQMCVMSQNKFLKSVHEVDEVYNYYFHLKN